MTKVTDEERARRRAMMKAAAERARAMAMETDAMVAERAGEREKAMIPRREVGIGLEQAREERFSNRTVAEIAESINGDDE